jgi:metallo-beta-lactamase class B
MKTDDFGLVDCNGVGYLVNGEALVIDTPATDVQSQALISKLQDELGARVIGVMIGHTHADSMGGLGAFHKAGINSYSSIATQRRARELGLPVPVVGYQTSLELRVADRVVRCVYFGPGHTVDNSVAYIVNERTLFGDCLVKALGVGRGFLGDANLGQWSVTVMKVREAFPEVELVVPGHGAVGNSELLDFTIEMFAADAETVTDHDQTPIK